MGSEERMLPVGVLTALERGATVLTANQRAARGLRHQFDRRNRRLGLERWQPPSLLAWDGWTAGLWRGLVLQGHAAEMLLNRAQEHSVWRAVLEGDTERQSLLSVDSLADMAAEAWRRLCSYGGQGRLREIGVSTDTRAFQRWAREFERRCRTESYLTQALLEERLRQAVAARVVEFETKELVLVGFDVLTPAQAALIAEMKEAGVALNELRVAVKMQQRELVEMETKEEELRTCAHWIRTRLEEHAETRIAVILPGLEEERAEIDRVLREVLAPELQDIGAVSDREPYEFSLGVSLAKTPMVTTALGLLRWVLGPLPLERVSRLLLSPYFAVGDAELGARAEFDAFELRRAKMLRPEISLEGLRVMVEQSVRRVRRSQGGQTLEGLRSALQRMRHTVDTMFGKDDWRSHAEWAEGMRKLLEAAGWAAREGRDSIEFQTQQKWEGALDEMTTLDFDGVRVRFGTALEELERMARQTLFAPGSRETPVQVMGPLEAAGSEFDAVWFLRAGDMSWPAATPASSLLPWQMRRELGMPGTDVTRDREYSRRVTERVAESAEAVIFSYAIELPEGRQRVSVILDGLGLEKVTGGAWTQTERKRAMVEMETMEDSAVLALPPDGVMRGGARILELQAACGFRAFAEQRLAATELKKIELGMDAMERGSVVHEVLELFWRVVKTQSALKDMADEERSEMLDWAIRKGLHRMEELSATEWDAAYISMQRERLHTLLEGWLQLEMERPAFEVKLLEAKLQEVQVGPLRLTVRVDRVDVSEVGEIIIDYKTGAAEPNDWLSDRPDAPQLPLYAILSEAEKLAGVAFAQVRAGKDRGLQGFATTADAGIKVKKMAATSLEEQVESWRQVLTRLATEFYHGDARVRPKSYPTTCSHCGLQLICRVDAAAMEDDGDGSATEADRG